VRGFLVAPLVVQGAVFGTVELSDMARDRVFSRDEIDLVEAVCRVAGLAMDNALLFDDLERRNREAELLNEIAARTSSSLDMGHIADAAVAGLERLVPVSSFALAMADGESWYLVHTPEPGRMPAQLEALEASSRAALEQLQAEGVIVVEGGEPPDGRHSLWGGEGSHVAIGLFDRERLVGALMMSSEVPGAFESVGRSLLERVGVHLSLAAHNARLYQEIKALHLGNLKGLSTALNAKDYYTLGHAARVAAYMVLLGRELGWEVDTIEQVREAAYLHDIGKIGVSDRVLLKQGTLNAEEWELMRQHPVVSADIIGPLFPEDLVASVRHHHERWDGAGYPDGLAGEAIPEVARAMCVVDSYDAMSLHRPYRGARTYEDCVAELRRCSGEQFDPAMTDAFLRVLEKLAKLRELSRAAAEEAAAHIDPGEHKALLEDISPDRPEYAHIKQELRTARDAYPQIRFMTTEAYSDGRCIVVVDGEDPASESFSPPGEDVMVDDAARQVLAGLPILSNVLFVDDHGVWANGIVPIAGADGEIVAAVVADAPALGWDGVEGLAARGGETPVSTLQRAAVRLGRAEIDAITDGLTGLYNHRHLHERLAEEIAESGHGGRALSLLFCDLDFFKDYNDHHGHAAGDEALRATARIIEQCTRRDDVAARYGGEEFVVLLPGVEEERALEIAGRIRAAVAERHAGSGALTISIGVAGFPVAAQTKEGLLDAADRAMYLAKRLGRDRVVAAKPLDA
jgi:diguanylate cyclase (GGDEF)-like protein